MIDEFVLTINISLAVYSIITTIVFFFTWRKRPDLVYWFAALIIYSIGHILLIFKQNSLIYIYLGNAAILLATMVVLVSTFIEYYVIVIRAQKETNLKRKETILLLLVTTISFLTCILSIIFLAVFSSLDILVAIIIPMIGLLIIVTVVIFRLFRKQRTITRLFMFFIFFTGILTATSTILALYYSWGTALNYATNFIFISFALIGGIAAPIEKQISDSEEKYRVLSENLEDEVKKRTKQLEVANKELEAFSFSVSHDLRNPLRNITAFSKILREEHAQELDAQTLDRVERIIASAERMDEIIDDLLEFSKASKEALSFEAIDLAKLTNEILEDLLQLYPHQTFNCQVEEKMVVTCDKRLIRIALENLLSNALKFSARKEKPTVVVGEKNENGRRVFFVKDNGVGFNMNHYQKLFVLFKRLHSERDFKGTGIGLVTVQRIIERHKGEIWAEGEENKGATFYFTL